MSQDTLNIIRSNAGLAADVRDMIGQTRGHVARTVNAGMTFLYWRIGKRIQMEVLQHERAEYGKEILATLSQELSSEFGRGYSYSALTRMVKFAEVFPDEKIVAALRRQLGWTHFLFYHRNLKRLIAIDLKLGNFKAEYKGQMELYLRWLAHYEQQPGEESPLGIILCAGKKEEQIELLELGDSGIHVAEYLTALPSRELLQQKLHDAIKISQARLEAKKRETE